MTLRGASADAVAALTETLGGLTTSDEASATAGDELFAVAALLRSEPSLRRVVTDVSVEGQAKAGLVREVLGDKLSSGVVDLVSSAVAQRWTVPRDLADALEALGVRAIAESAGDTSGAAQLADELFEVEQLIAHSPDLRDALGDPSRSAADKGDLLRDLLRGKCLTATVQLVTQSLSGSFRSVTVALQSYQVTVADVRNQGVATVHTARGLSAAEQERLAAALQRTYGREVHLNILVDAEVIGGIRVEIGDDVIDGTVSARLDDARRQLAG